jgi:hypothetical protein
VKSYSLSHLSDQILLRDLSALLAQDRTTTAALLAHIAEVDARRLYRGEVKKCVNTSGGDLLIGLGDPHTVCEDDAAIDVGGEVFGEEFPEATLG